MYDMETSASRGSGATQGGEHVVEPGLCLFAVVTFTYLYLLFTIPAAVFYPVHDNWADHLITYLVNNVPEEWFGYGLADFALDLVN